MTRRLQKLFSVHLADQKEAAVAVAVLRGPSRPFVDKKKLQLPFSVALRVLCGQKVLPLPFFAALRGKKKLPLPFSATLRGQNKINASIPNAFKKACPGFPALAVLVTITTNDYPF
ncbi:MAG: hypothetical protein OXC27_14115 [Caldilineaceae bacterium]|nr:hypothetical protein [Caldilineaceae bacterium]